MNNFITPTWVLREVARILVNNLKFSANVDRTYDDKYKVGGAKVGYTVQARLPQRFRTTKGQAFVAQAINDQVVPVSLTDQANIGTSFSTADATMIIEDVRKRYVNPAAEQLANTIDFDGLSRCYLDVYNSVGTPGTTPNTNLTYLTAGVVLTNGAVPIDGRVTVVDPLGMATIVNANAAIFNPQGTISESFKTGMFARNVLGIDEWYQTQNIARHTTGSFTSATPLVDGANQTGTSILTKAFASGATTLNKGDVVQFAGVYAANPQNYSSTGRLQDFVVTQTVSDTSGAVTISISPSLIPATSGSALATVTASPADNAKVYVLGSTITTGAGALTATVSPQSLVYHPEAFILVMADLDGDLDGATVARVAPRSLNVSLRYVRQYQVGTDQKAARIDCLYGWKTFRPEMACRVWG